MKIQPDSPPESILGCPGGVEPDVEMNALHLCAPSYDSLRFALVEGQSCGRDTFTSRPSVQRCGQASRLTCTQVRLALQTHLGRAGWGQERCAQPTRFPFPNISIPF